MTYAMSRVGTPSNCFESFASREWNIGPHPDRTHTYPSADFFLFLLATTVASRLLVSSSTSDPTTTRNSIDTPPAAAMEDVPRPQAMDAARLEPLQAAAFRALCQHLQQHSDQVSNIDLMTLAGFCRNCLAKVRMYICKTTKNENVDSNDEMLL
jgi:hypothetical protein